MPIRAVSRWHCTGILHKACCPARLGDEWSAGIEMGLSSLEEFLSSGAVPCLSSSSSLASSLPTLPLVLRGL